MLFGHPKKKDPYLPVGKPRFARGQTRVCRGNNPGRPTAFWPWPTLYYTQAQKPENHTKKSGRPIRTSRSLFIIDLRKI